MHSVRDLRDVFACLYPFVTVESVCVRIHIVSAMIAHQPPTFAIASRAEYLLLCVSAPLCGSASKKACYPPWARLYTRIASTISEQPT